MHHKYLITMLEVPDLLLPEGNVGDPAAMMTLHGTGSQELKSASKISRVVPPEVNCHHVSVAGKNYLSVKVANASHSPVILKEAQVLVNKNELQTSNQKIRDSSSETSLKNPEELSEVVSKVSVKIPVTQIQAMPFPLLQHEEVIFLCNIEMQSAQMSIAKFQKIKIPLLFALTFQTEFEDGPASMRAQYHLPKLRLQSPSLVMLTECSSPVKKYQSFTVTYTIQNSLQDFMGISLTWIPSMPSHDASADQSKYSAINEVLVCQQPITDLGICKKGSTVSAKVEFQALSTGVLEVGKFMKLKLQYAIPASSKAASSSSTLGTSSSLFSSSSSKSAGSYKSSEGGTLASSHAPLSASRSHQYDVPVLEQGSLGRPPFVRYLSQNQIKTLQGMKPRQRVSGRSQSYGGEIPSDDAPKNSEFNRHSLSRQLSSNTSGASTFQRARRVSYVDRIVKHPCQVYVIESEHL
ncbi:trafficking protein particle complex subunit 14-like isoform X2 [Apostichopus japonicus]|uniref:trafficking protein particle complex subunit 14-like isoform X2 n=1 Tax=Stichopus japonicus TaxID=307972 RepID=UPI003AB4717F